MQSASSDPVAASGKERWADSDARKILVMDLESGILPAFSEELGPKEAWNEIYIQLKEFQGISYEQFRQRLNSLRKAHRVRQSMAIRDSNALEHDRKLHPQQPTNIRGEPVFDMSAAKPLLSKDILSGAHRRLSMRDLYKSRPEYAPFDCRIFKDCVHQEIRRQKFNAYLEAKRKDGDRIDQITQNLGSLSITGSKQEERKVKIDELKYKTRHAKAKHKQADEVSVEKSTKRLKRA